VLVLSTGGTIASRRRVGGAFVATDSASDLVAQFSSRSEFASLGTVAVETQDVMCVGSYLLKPEDMLEIARRIGLALMSNEVIGIVVTHGTDTMEETAFLVDLVHTDARPVVFTGAQRSADAPDTDGPRNLDDALTVATHEDARGLGVLIVFDGQIFAAAGTRKTHTLASAAFSSTDSGPIGRVHEGSLVLTASPKRLDPLALDSFDLAGVRVDIVPYYPGTDTTALRAVAAAGATGIILETTGAGNANSAFCLEVARLTASGVVVALSTRVMAGPVTALYGAGGGIDLVKAGAISVGTLRSPQARVLLIALLSCLRDPVRVREELRRQTSASAAARNSPTATPSATPIHSLPLAQAGATSQEMGTSN
jgi:L-asparaginase